MSAQTRRTNSEDETIALGREIAERLTRPCVVLLIGDLGAGKTTLAKGIVEGLGASPRDDVSSPTFTLIHDYGKGVFHLDLYRLDTAQQVIGTGIDDLLAGDTILLVEWGERFPELFPQDRLEIRLVHTGGDSRGISIALG